MANFNLSYGCIDKIIEGNQLVDPIVKVLSIKPINSGENKKYRLSVSDGKTSSTFFLLASTLNHLYEDSSLRDNTIIRIDKYVMIQKKDKPIIVLVNLTILDENMLGTPMPSNSEASKHVDVIKTKQQEPKTIESRSLISNTKITPINLINAYQNKWTIEGRISQKDAMRTYTNAKGEGKLFSFVICDSTCDIKVAAFNNEASKFFDLIQLGKTYSISKGIVKTANQKFNRTKCEYEISLISDSEISEVQDNSGIPQMLLNFVSIDEIGSRQPDTMIDVVGIAHTIADTTSFVHRTTNRELLKREINLIDRSGSSVRLTLWGEDVHRVDNVENPVLVIKSAMVKEFNGRTLSCGTFSTLLVNPEGVDEAMSLLAWYSEGGHANMPIKSLSSSGTGGTQMDAPTSNLLALSSDPNSEKGDYFSMKATVVSLRRENCVYKACTAPSCNKKLVDLNNGTYKCEKCNTSGTDFSYRLLLNAHLNDHSGDRWVTCFQNSAEVILGRSAQEIGEMFELERKKELDSVFKVALAEDFQFKVRTRNETYNDETRMKISVVDCRQVDLGSHLRSLLEQIDKC